MTCCESFVFFPAAFSVLNGKGARMRETKLAIRKTNQEILIALVTEQVCIFFPASFSVHPLGE